MRKIELDTIMSGFVFGVLRIFALEKKACNEKNDPSLFLSFYIAPGAFYFYFLT